MNTFKRVKLIGQGTYSKVYLYKNAYDYCIVNKCIRDENEETISPYISKEISILKRLNHPNIIKYLRHEHVNSIVNIYLEYGGISLIEYIEHFDVKYIMKQILNAVDYLHDNSIAHLDISTRNILIYKNNNIKLVDFGMATYFNSKIYENMCTISFSSPEMLLQIFDNFPATDLWSIGCIFYYLLTNSHLWLNREEDLQVFDIFTKFGYAENYKNCKKWNSKYNEFNYKRSLIFTDPLVQDLISKFLTVNYKERITIKDALNHNYFKN